MILSGWNSKSFGIMALTFAISLYHLIALEHWQQLCFTLGYPAIGYHPDPLVTQQHIRALHWPALWSA
jgi:hypothetical protein